MNMRYKTEKGRAELVNKALKAAIDKSSDNNSNTHVHLNEAQRKLISKATAKALQAVTA